MSDKKFIARLQAENEELRSICATAEKAFTDNWCVDWDEIKRAAMAPSDVRPNDYQLAVHNWAVECFGEADSNDHSMRCHRFLEEALELVQAGGCSKAEALQLVDYVYGRPTGELAQEVGGVTVTLAALCSAFGLNMRFCGDAELARVWEKFDVIRDKHRSKPKFSALPIDPEKTITGDTQ